MRKWKLADFVEINPTLRMQRGKPYPFVEMSDLQPGRRYVRTAVSRDLVGSGSHFEPNDVLFARITPCLENGKIAQYIGAGGLAFGSTEFVVFRARADISDRSFVYYLATSRQVRGPAEKSMSGASGRQRADVDVLRTLEIEAPDFATQGAIGSVLSAYDNLIENNIRRIRILEDLAAAVYHEWFVEFRFPGHKRTRIARSPIGLTPVGWQIASIPEVVELNPKVKLEKGRAYPFVPMGCLFEHSMVINEADVEVREAGGGAKFQNGDTLFARITPCLENGKTAFVHFLPTNDDAAFGSTEYIVMRSRQLSAEYVYLMARTPFVRDHAIKSMSGATGRQRVREECFSQLQIAVPPKDVLEKFRTSVKPMFDAVFVLDKKNRVLRKTRDMLLPKLISGEIDVSKLGGANAVAVTVDAEPILKIEPKPEAKVKREASDPFKEAILIAAIVRSHTSPTYQTVARFRRTKLRYLVHRKAEHDVRMRFQKQAAGPYDSASRYKGPEAIALKNKYVEARQTQYGPAFAVGTAIDEIDKYLPNYGLADALAWVMQNFKFKKNPELELLTTVDYAALDLISRGEAVSCASIRDLIASEPKWLPKLDKKIFSDIGIQSALEELERHFGRFA